MYFFLRKHQTQGIYRNQRRRPKLSGLYLIQDGKSYVPRIKVTFQLHLWKNIKYSCSFKINDKHELHYKNVISWPLQYSDPWKQHVTANKSKPSVSTTLIGLKSNLLWRQTFKNLRKKSHQDETEGNSEEKSSISVSGNKLTHFLQFIGNLAHLSVLQHSQARAARYKYVQNMVGT